MQSLLNREDSLDYSSITTSLSNLKVTSYARQLRVNTVQPFVLLSVIHFLSQHGGDTNEVGGGMPQCIAFHVSHAPTLAVLYWETSRYATSVALIHWQIGYLDTLRSVIEDNLYTTTVFYADFKFMQL